MPTYDPSGHPLLSGEASALSSDELDAQASVAEEVLGLEGTEFDAAEKDRATRAVALQVNLQVDRPSEADWAESETEMDQSVTYRSDQGGRAVPVHPTAERIASSLLADTGESADGWGTARAAR